MQEKALNKYSAKNEIEGCLLCYDAPCTKGCSHGLDPAKVIRSLRFKNLSGAAEAAKASQCSNGCTEKKCMTACLKGKIDRMVAIPGLMAYAAQLEIPEIKSKEVDLKMTFCGVECENPFFLSSSIVASNYEMVAKAFEMGWAGAAFKTIGTFIPEETSPRFATIRDEGNSFIGFKNIEQISDHPLEENLDYLRQLKKDYPKKVIIASILGQNEAEWTYLAQKVTEAGADIIECNFSCPHMSGDGLGADVGQDPELVALYTAATRLGTDRPILAKMTPNLGHMELPAIAAMKAGATGIAAINTIKSIMNIDLDDFASGPKVDGKSSVGGYSGKTVKPIALRFIYDMKNHEKLKDVPISGMGGIDTWHDAAEFLALGCTNLQITTSVMQYGYRIIDDLKEGLANYLMEKGFRSPQELVGLALPNLVPVNQLDHHSVVYPKIDKNKCLGCGRCYLSCYDGGHQALKISEADGKPQLIAKLCAGCQLCANICPVEAISEAKRVAIK
jgi:dihydropyrimidine dehydrogenase (NAD+) subunit PreA